MEIHYITAEHLGIEQVGEVVADAKIHLALSEEAREKISKCREYLDNKLESVDAPIYGINTGFGSLCSTSIDDENLGQLQENLVKSHACGNWGCY